MAEWLGDTEPRRPPAPRWTVRSSLVLECAWASIPRVPGQPGKPAVHAGEFPVREAFYSRTPGLIQRIQGFWNDDGAEFIEFVTLAKRAKCLWTDDPELLMDGLRAQIGSGEGSETFDSERPEVVAAIRTRLRRLAEEPKLAAAWLDLVGEIVGLVRAALDEEARVAVEATVRLFTNRAARATSWQDLTQPLNHGPECDMRETAPLLAARTVANGGEAALVPAWLARQVMTLSFGDLVIVSPGVERQPLPSDATRAVARRLRALSDPTRLAIVEQLALRPRAVGELARELLVSQPTVSNHVRVLREAGVVRDGPRARQRHLEVDATGLELLLDEVRTLVLGADPAR